MNSTENIHYLHILQNAFLFICPNFTLGTIEVWLSFNVLI